jgi:hypothetical protein
LSIPEPIEHLQNPIRIYKICWENITLSVSEVVAFEKHAGSINRKSEIAI